MSGREGNVRDRPRSRLARVMRVVVAVVIVPLLLGALAVPAAIFYARSERGRAQVRDLLLAQARSRVPGLQLGRVDGDYLRQLVLRDLTVPDSDGRAAVHIDALLVRFDLPPLLRRTVVVREARVDGARLLVRPMADGSLNVNHLVAPGPSAPEQAPAAPGASSPNPWHVRLDRLEVKGLRADVQLSDERPALIATLDLIAAATLDGDRLGVRLEHLMIDTHGARFTAQGQAVVENLSGAHPRLAEYQAAVSVRDLDPAAVQPGAPVGQVGVTASASGAGVPLSPGSEATIQVQLAPSRLAGVEITSGRITALLDETRWRLTSAAVHAANVALTATGHGDGPTLTLDLEAALDGKLPGPPARVPAVQGRGRVAVHVEGTLPDAELVTVRGQVKDLRAGAVRLGAATLRARLHHPLSAPGGQLRLAARALRLSAGAPRVDRLVLTSAGDRRGLRVDAAVSGPRVHGGVRARGTLAPGQADVRVEALSLDFTSARYRQTLALQTPARLRVRGGDAVRWDGVALRGAGYLFTGDVVTTGLYRLPPQRREPLAQVALSLRQASFKGITPIDARLHATLLRRRIVGRLAASMPAARATVDVEASVPVVVAASGTPRLAGSGDVRIDVRSNDVHLEAVPLLEKELRRQGVSGGVATVNAAVTGDVAHPEVKAGFALRDVMYRNIRGYGRDSKLKTVAGLGGSLTIDTAPGAIRAGAVVSIRKVGVLTADARLALDVRRVLAGADLTRAPLQATVTVPGFALASLSEFTDDMKGISGQLTGQATVTGTLGRPSGTAELRVTSGKVDELGFGQMLVTGQASDGRVDATLSVQDLAGGILTGTGELQRREGDRLQATVQARDLDLRFARLFFPTVRETAGKAQLQASVVGSLAAPVPTADLTIEKGRLGLIGQPTFRDIRLAASLRPGRADVARLEARSGDGALSGSGWVILDGLSPWQAVFKAHAHRFLVAAAGSTGALIDGDVAAEAALRRDVLAGKVEVPRAQIWLPKGPSAGASRNLQKIGDHDDVRFVDAAALAAAERRRAATASAKPTPLALGVRTGPVYIRGKDLDIQLDSTLTVGTVTSGPRRGAPTVAGGIHVRNGRINIQGQRFDFMRGEITFDGSPDVNPWLDIILERQYPDARVEVALSGTPRKPELRMTSDPPVYDQAQIVSLILTGQPGGQPSNGRAFDPKAAVATAVLSKLADKIAPEIGLDVLRVESVEARNPEGAATGDANTRIEVGKYISDRVYLSYAHVFGAPDTANQNEAHVEYRLTRRWMLETIFGDAGVGGVDALWTVRY